MRKKSWVTLGLVAAVLGLATVPRARASEAPVGFRPAKGTRTMALDEVRVGMKGYGLSVFHGTKIEPFRVEVASVMRGFAPQRSVIWIRCTDARMEKSGPVSGMSGSPIYLFDEGESQELAQGGRLAGAFAYGFPNAKECYAGVQPIESMLLAGERAAAEPSPKVARAGGGGTAAAAERLRRLLGVSSRRDERPSTAWRLEVLLKALGEERSVARAGGEGWVPAPDSSGRLLAPMALPVAAPSQAAAELMGPLLEGTGMAAFYGGGTGTMPPPGIDAQTIQIEPGAVLAVPLLLGDAEMAAAGTVTDVSADGRVLAFGHSLLGRGEIRLPVTSGYIHLVFPSNTQSFKLSGCGPIRGTLVRDEQAAVVAKPGSDCAMADIQVRVEQPAQPARSYQYQAVRREELSSIAAAMAVVASLTAVQETNPENSLQVRMRMVVDGGRELAVSTLVPRVTATDMDMFVQAPLAVLASNDYESLLLRDLEVDMVVLPQVQEVSIVEAAVDRLEVRPGETVGVMLKLQPHHGQPRQQRLAFQVPPNIPDGEYELMVSGAEGYLGRLTSAKPFLFKHERLDDLLQTLRLVLGTDSRAFYLTMQLPARKGMAVGRRELASLPSSVQAMLAGPSTTSVSEFSAVAEHRVAAADAVKGEASFKLTVRREPNG